MRFQLLLVVCAGLAACAPMTESECRGTDWAQLGYDDGLRGNQARIDQYAYQCARYNVTAPEKEYMDAWRDGYGEHQRRAPGTLG